MAAAMSGFARVVAELSADELAEPSRCEGWTVRDVIDHVVAGERFTAGLMSGRPFDGVVAGLTGLDPDGHWD